MSVGSGDSVVGDSVGSEEGSVDIDLQLLVEILSSGSTGSRSS